MVLFGLLFAFLILGVPIAASMGISSLIYMLMTEVNPIVVIQKMFAGIDSTAYLAVPFFILAGELMNRGGIARRIVNLAEKAVGNIHGGMGIVAIISSMFFAAISGSAIATAAAIGGVMYAGMLRSGYSKGFSATIVAASSPIGIIIPPSIAFIIYAVLARVSVADLYKVGFPAGFIVGIALIIPTYFIARKRKYMDRAVEIESGEIVLNGVPELKSNKEISFAKNLIESLWALGTPFIIVGGVFAGIFTPTESAVVAVVYSILVGMFVYKEISFKDLGPIFNGAAKGTAGLMLIMSAASLFAYVMVLARIPQTVFATVQNFEGNFLVIMLMINLILLVAGMFMESGSIQYIAVPVLLPIVMTFGMDPVHFGIILVTNLAIGMLTPPFGVTLFTSAKTFNASIQEVSMETFPYLIALIAALFFITYVPASVMWIL
ncbi:MAG: TRAP transporter, DctM subunit [Clostridiales bacterium 38_11]|nr:MAG: TRAP transporter, DctM subunit [Clostridiales bacterium 38_11]HBH13073.1 C4-dicarboxylate ABC transporter permease [Clostridiales bacterium]